MRRQIRFGVFETNSSSTHTLTICTKKEFEEWKKGDLVLDWDKLVPAPKELTAEDKIEIAEDYYNRHIKKDFYKEFEDLSEDEKSSIIRQAEKNGWFDEDEDLKTYEQWVEDEYLETYEESYTTEHGDEVVVFGKYGNDY